MVVELINKGFEWLQIGTGFFREIVLRVATVLPLESELASLLIILGISFLLGFRLIKGLVMNPLSSRYMLITSTITLLIFIILNYV